MNASLLFELTMYLNSFYFGMFAFSEWSIGLMKAVNLQYSDDVVLNESFILLGICAVETFRLILGRKGSLSEYDWQVFVSVLLTVPSVCGVCYFMLHQTYVLKLEYIIIALLVALQAAETVFALAFLVSLCQPTDYYNT